MVSEFTTDLSLGTLTVQGSNPRSLTRTQANDDKVDICSGWGLNEHVGSRGELPAGFTETYVGGLTDPTAMAIVPDERVVCEQGGTLRVIRTALCCRPRSSPSPWTPGVEGPVGVAFDPTRPIVRAPITVVSNPLHNRVSRFTADGDVAEPREDPARARSARRREPQRGALHFGLTGSYRRRGQRPWGQLPGPPTCSASSCVNSDGSFLRHPFVGVAGAARIWAYGATPFPSPAVLHGPSLHQRRRAEHLRGDRRRASGANYGWSICEGPYFRGPRRPAPTAIDFTDDLRHTHSTGCVTGGDFTTRGPAVPRRLHGRLLLRGLPQCCG
jgi:hypothetical protein